jgi:hypothetical protein
MSAMSARILTTTICNERAHASLPDVTRWGPVFAPHAQASHPLSLDLARSDEAMTDISVEMKSEDIEMHAHSPSVVLRSLVIGLTAFLTVVDLFAT